MILAALATQAQAPTDIFEKAPPGVEEALRERVAGFYQTWIEGKFRAGEKFVAEGAQDDYYQMTKQKYESCEVIRIHYEREFQDAMVTVACKGKWNIQGQMLDTKLAHTYFWTIEKGLWSLSNKPVSTVQGPFGTYNYNAAGKDPALFNPATGLPKDADAIKSLGKGILGAVSVDKSEVQLSSYEPSTAVIKIKNGLTGNVSVSVRPDGAPLGFSYTLDKESIPAESEAKLTLKMDPKDKNPKSTMSLTIDIDPVSKHIPVVVTFSIPPELQKVIEKSKTGK